MKLLIVDDEALTRNGLAASINWMKLGIDEVCQASDGLDGCQAAALHKPDIILSDVRMPRMSGIDMLERIRQFLPDSVFIFMSGFSDKEYLKAAIRLQAVSYVEKPLDLAEIREAVQTAIARKKAIDESRSAESFSDSAAASRLALSLTLPYSTSSEQVESLSRSYCRKYGSADLFHAAFTVILLADERRPFHASYPEELTAALHDYIRNFHMHVISGEKRSGMIVFHLFRKDDFSLTTVRMVTDYLQKLLAEQNLSWYLAAGTIVSGIRGLYESYSSAVIALQQCFFCPPGTCLIVGDEIPASGQDPQDIYEQLFPAIRNADRQAIESLTGELFRAVSGNTALMRASVMSAYYQLASLILEQRRQRQLPGSGLQSTSEEALISLNQSFSFPELHALLGEMLGSYLQDIENYVPENSSVYLIKNYIRSHYADPSLSTKEISDYANLSASYACTVFKNETGQTLNQFLTEYRLDKARELLADPRNNIAEVASRVGYNDSNYFGKAFKKHTGLSPSEYRESRQKP